MIREATENDFVAIANIYNHYIRNTTISFEETVLDHKEICKRVKDVVSAGFPWIVAEKDSKVIGYAYASRWNELCSYKNTVEVSVYLDHKVIGHGYGSELYHELFRRLRHNKIHAIVAGIALPNKESIKLHEKFGMKKVAHFQEIGYKLGQWVDVGYWQVLVDS